jgi:hypothetical protein
MPKRFLDIKLTIEFDSFIPKWKPASSEEEQQEFNLYDFKDHLSSKSFCIDICHLSGLRESGWSRIGFALNNDDMVSGSINFEITNKRSWFKVDAVYQLDIKKDFIDICDDPGSIWEFSGLDIKEPLIANNYLVHLNADIIEGMTELQSFTYFNKRLNKEITSVFRIIPISLVTKAPKISKKK